MFYKEGVLRNFEKYTGNTCTKVSFLIEFFKKETLAQVLFCEFFEISKNIFFTEHLRATASDSVSIETENHCLFSEKDPS